MKCVHLRTASRSAAHLLAVIIVLATCSPVAATAASTQRREASPFAADAAFSLCFPYAPKDAEGDNAILYFTSETGIGGAVTVSFVNPDGTQAGTQESYTLAGSETKVVDVAQIGALPAGIHQAIVTSNGKLAGAAHIRNSVWGSIGIYQAVDCAQASDEVFGVVYAGGAEGATSVLHVMNGGAAPANISLEVYVQGSPAVSSAEFTLAALGSLRFSTAELPPGVTLPNGTGWVRVVTTAPAIRGVLAKEQNGLKTYSNAVTGGQVSGASVAPAVASLVGLPRLPNPTGLDVTTPFTTQIYLSNAVNGVNTFNMSFYRPDGSQGAPPKVDTLTAFGESRIYKAILAVTAPRGMYSIVVGAQGPIAIQTELLPDTSGTPGKQAAYSGDSLIVTPRANSVVLPGVVYNADVVSVVAIQNMGGSADPTTISIVNAQGEVVDTAQYTIQPGATASIDLRSIAGVTQPFTGSVVATSLHELAGQIDLFAKLGGLGLEKSSTATTVTAAGQIVPYKYVVKNDGNVTLTGVTLSDNRVDGGTAVCTVGTLAAGATSTCTAQHTVTQAEMDAGGYLTNLASATSDQTAPVEATLSIPIVQAPGLSLQKSSTATTVSAVGQVVPYKYVVKNDGNITLTGVTLSDNRVDGGTAVCAVVTLAAGATSTCTAQHTVTQAEMDAGGYLTNLATTVSNQTAPVEATLSIPIIRTPGLSLQKSSTTTTVTAAGQVVPYKYVVKNDGNVTLTGVTLNDNRVDGGTAVCTVGTLAPGATSTCTAQHTVTQAEMDAGGYLTNLATAKSDQTAPVEATLSIPIVQPPVLPLQSVAISGSAFVAGVGAPVDLVAVVSPTTSTKPITYTWMGDEQATRVNMVDSTQNQERFTWTTPGVKEVKVMAANAGGGAAYANHAVRVPADSEVVGNDGSTVLGQTGVGGWSLELTVPAGSVEPGHTLLVTPISENQLDGVISDPAQDTLLGLPVLLEAYWNGALVPGLMFGQPATLRLHYDDVDVARFDEARLRVLTVQDGQWLDAAETCSPSSEYVRRPAQNELEVQICHLSPYSLAAPWEYLYLPTLGKR